jgi:hypothetical protein
MTELTIGIATCGRPRTLKRCIRSINRYTKTPYKLIILDNAKAFTKDKRAHVENFLGITHKLIDIKNKKIGCSESNNLIAEACRTDYLMHMDDDVIIRSNVIDVMFEYIKNNKEMIVGCKWNFRPSITEYIVKENEGKKILSKKTYYSNDKGWANTDELNHSMILNMKLYDKVKWDNNFIWKGDRVDFFYQCKINNIQPKVYLDDYVEHTPAPFKYGSIKKQQSAEEAKQYFENKWNIIPNMGWKV